MIQIYHNPRCSKSRQGVTFLKEKNLPYEEVRYLDQGLTTDELKGLLKKLNCSAMELIRTNEAVWKSEYKDKEMGEEQLIKAMASNPRLVERPVVVNGEKAVVARPTERINEII
jgi:arsenate reductase